jgi:hypothetical protein
MTKTTITVDETTHANVVRLQSVLNLTATSGEKYSLSQTVNYAVSNMQFTPIQSSNLTAIANTYSGTACTMTSTRLSLRKDK